MLPGSLVQALTIELTVVGRKEVIDRGSEAAVWWFVWFGLPALSATLLAGVANGHSRDLVPPVSAHAG